MVILRNGLLADTADDCSFAADTWSLKNNSARSAESIAEDVSFIVALSGEGTEYSCAFLVFEAGAGQAHSGKQGKSAEEPEQAPGQGRLTVPAHGACRMQVNYQ
jgi:hypothetical protein